MHDFFEVFSHDNNFCVFHCAFFVHCAFVTEEKLGEKWSRVKKSGQFDKLKLEKCENLRAFQVQTEVSEVGSFNAFFEIEIVSECWIIIFFGKLLHI